MEHLKSPWHLGSSTTVLRSRGLRAARPPIKENYHACEYADEGNPARA